MESEKEENPSSQINPNRSLENSHEKHLSIEGQLENKLEHAFHYQQGHQLVLHEVAKIAIEHDPIDLAHAVTRLPPNARIIVYNNLPDLQAKIIFMINTGNNTRSAIFKQINDTEIQK